MIKKTLILIATALAASASFAEIKMPRVFSDNMVVQAGKPNRFWGTSLPNADITLAFDGKTFKTKSDKNGAWLVETSAFEKSFVPREIAVYENGKPAKTIKNVLVGEVWLLSGQSNMQYGVGGTPDCAAAKKRASANIRVFYQPSNAMSLKRETDSHESSHWKIASDRTVPSFSAIGYFFAEELSKKLDTPVGLIDTPLGGTKMQCWLPEEKLTTQYLSETLARHNRALKTFDYKKQLADYEKRLADFDSAHKGKKLSKEEAQKRQHILWTRPNQISPWRPQEAPCCMYNAKISPVQGIAIRGFVWYQGEDDASNPRRVHFDENLVLLVNTWRELWNSKNMPFYVFQLPSYTTKSDWADVRERQYKACKSLKNARLICTFDTGEEFDIHPRDKMPLAKRLFDLAMQYTYKDKSFFGDFPELKGVEYRGDKAYATFVHCGKGLNLNGSPRGFEVLVGGKWTPASARLIAKNRLEISAAEKGAKVEGVRYGWKCWAKPDVCLFGSNGMPAYPFTNAKGQ